ncbi:MAG: hypothetical protein IJJ70_03350 [Treponema sp.]|nr:hypothetical protein [Treponema sp.]MBR0486730.1 hypothetical protein [Treponema sp.]
MKLKFIIGPAILSFVWQIIGIICFLIFFDKKVIPEDQILQMSTILKIALVSIPGIFLPEFIVNLIVKAYRSSHITITRDAAKYHINKYFNYPALTLFLAIPLTRLIYIAIFIK